jgi:hypothetical protein
MYMKLETLKKTQKNCMEVRLTEEQEVLLLCIYNVVNTIYLSAWLFYASILLYDDKT